jgi:hypothetical protein
MSFAEFAARYQSTEAALQSYVDGLPVWVRVWRGWMFAIFGLAALFVIWRVEARWLAATMIVSIFAYNLVAMARASDASRASPSWRSGLR